MRTKHFTWLCYGWVHNITDGLYLKPSSMGIGSTRFVMNDYGFLVQIGETVL